MTAQTPDANRELHISVPDDVYEQLQILAASKHVPTEEYVAGMLADDVAEARFLSGSQQFITEHGHAFAERFGPRPRTAGEHAA
ncbi:hypothetical protein [Streptomyces odonnellii]|uniref:hypothetical protein n=1 Tax=Streptomyces odonnellii TaxID=1417980 RepID=UPI0006261AFA|nr:hypothetical protein [Streptomyces odonnellii]